VCSVTVNLGFLFVFHETVHICICGRGDVDDDAITKVSNKGTKTLVNSTKNTKNAIIDTVQSTSLISIGTNSLTGCFHV